MVNQRRLTAILAADMVALYARAYGGIAENDPDFNPIRSHPRFQKIVEMIGNKS